MEHSGKLELTWTNKHLRLLDDDLDAFRTLGRRLASESDDDLRRIELGARIVTGSDGLRRTELVTTTGERISSAAQTIPLADARAHLLDAVLGSPVVGAHQSEARAAEKIVDAFLEGLGDDGERVLSAFLDRAAASTTPTSSPSSRTGCTGSSRRRWTRRWKAASKTPPFAGRITCPRRHRRRGATSSRASETSPKPAARGRR